MNIPTITTTAPFPYCREYASSPVAINPSYDRGIKERTGEVTFEFACFLIREGELDRSEYIALILEDERTHAEIEARMITQYGTTTAFYETLYSVQEKKYKKELNEAIDEQIKTDNSDWIDYE